MRWAHAYQVLAVAEEAEQLLPTDREIEALDRLDEAHDDIREALEWSMEQGDGAFALRLAGAAGRVLADARPPHGGPPAARRGAVDGGRPAGRRTGARRSSGAGLLASYQGDYRLGEAYLREALAVAREQGDEEAEAVVLNWLGTNAYGGGDLDAAEALRVREPRAAAADRRPRRGSRSRSTRSAASTTSAATSTARGRCSWRASRSRRALGNENGDRRRADQPRPRRARRRAARGRRGGVRGGDRRSGSAPATGSACRSASTTPRCSRSTRAASTRPPRCWPAPTTSRATSATGPRWPTRWPTSSGSRSSAATSTAARPARSAESLPRAVGAWSARIIVLLALEGAGRARRRAAATTSSRSGCGPPPPPTRGQRVREHAGRRAAAGAADGPSPRAARRRRVRRRVGRRGGRMTTDEAVAAAMALVATPAASSAPT